MSLPPLSRDALPQILSTLFEPSPALGALVAAVPDTALSSYGSVIDACEEVSQKWGYDDKAVFVGGHPMIGEVGNLSALSAKEQASAATRPVVLSRLAHLNELYCVVFPSLRFVTFVNGRPRSAIVNEMERTIGIPLSPYPLPDDYPVTEPGTQSEEVSALRRDPSSQAWRDECDRALADVWAIARARVKGMGLQ